MKWVFVFLFVLISSCCFGQEPQAVSQSSYATFNRQVHIARDHSFLNVGNGIGNQEALLWEGQFATQYAIAKKNKPWTIVFNPKAVIRMADEESYPLRPPSFHVDLSYQRHLSLSAFDMEDGLFYIGIGHHSNGQAGVFYLPGDTVINMLNGNFAQNHIEGGLSFYRNELKTSGAVAFRYLSFYARVTPPFSAEWSGVETLDRLGFYRPFVGFGIGGVRSEKESGPLLGLRKNSNLTAQIGYIVGEMKDRTEPELDKRLIIDIQYQYVLPFFKDISLQAKYYKGQDFYNIRFNNTLSNLSFGFASNIGTIKAPVSYVGD